MIVSSFTIKFNGDGDAFAVPILAFGLPLPRPAEHPAPSPSVAKASTYDPGKGLPVGVHTRTGNRPKERFVCYFAVF